MATKQKATKSRSAITGRYVTKASAKKNPRTTVTESASNRHSGVVVLNRQIERSVAEMDAAIETCQALINSDVTWPQQTIGQIAENLEEFADNAFSAWQHSLRAAHLQEALDIITKK